MENFREKLSEFSGKKTHFFQLRACSKTVQCGNYCENLTTL
ncbi:hypothetical protein LEP1GSC008_4200 [Leptospira kirschneri serovar Bulgarica str. Nikolaevo]|uniref:Uncharacterized protein n=1 Tax=Leptospira kirschneri serovar Bulgarica str. Nikolaevo TaxID=1240687 RepID=M6FBC4_9LEPT|nr:hypothetical protein LEP1GSC008_4200 [Leptospira kirschneri serovar Bulgarica str. Nikolaevo]